MNIGINKQLEFIYAIQAVIKHNFGDEDYDYGFIETPEIPYMEELVELFKDIDLTKFDYYFKSVFLDEGDTSILGIALDDNYNLKYQPNFVSSITETELADFLSKLKDLSERVNWDDFYNKHIDFYKDLTLRFSDFPKEFNLNGFVDYYRIEPDSFNYNPSVLINGGFGLSDDKMNFYYLRGFIYNKEKNDFNVYMPAIVECLFHEFSHPIVNALVDKYFDLIEDPFKLYDIAIESNLHPGYSADIRTLYYEYLVRANAYILTLLYYPDFDIDMEYNSSIGFNLLEDFVKVICDNLSKYNSFEELYKEVIIPYINGLNKVICK